MLLEIVSGYSTYTITRTRVQVFFVVFYRIIHYVRVHIILAYIETLREKTFRNDTAARQNFCE